MNITFFANAKPFIRDWKEIQKISILSWLKYGQVIISGDEEGVSEVCAEYGLIHAKYAKLNLKSQMEEVEQLFQTDIVCRVMCDCVILDGIQSAYDIICDNPTWGVVAGRYNVPHLVEDIAKEREVYRSYPQSPLCSADAHIFSRGQLTQVPEIVLGMGGEDNWLNKFFIKNSKLVHSKDLILLHQEHSRAYLRGPETPGWAENQQVYVEAGGGSNLDEAQLVLENGILHAQ